MDFAKARYNSIYDKTKTEWKRTYEYSGTITANCTAKVVLPNKFENIKSGDFQFEVSIKIGLCICN